MRFSLLLAMYVAASLAVSISPLCAAGPGRDTTPPTISSVTVTPAMVAAGESVHVVVNATDNMALASVKAGGVSLQLTSGTSWEGSMYVDSALGTHTIAVVATDTAGNSASSQAGNYRTVNVVGASTKCISDPIMAKASHNYLFRFWGKVTTDGTDRFLLEDGSGKSVRVIAPGYSLANGDQAQAFGVLDVSTSPATLTSLASRTWSVSNGVPPLDPSLFRDPVDAVNVSLTPGVVEINLEAKITPINVNGTIANLMTYNGFFPGPTIRVKKGDILKVHLKNSLPATTEKNILGFTKNQTNLHVHGMHVSPEPPGDYVMYSLDPGQSYDHEYDTRYQEAGTLNFYHPHRHGVVAEQYWGGLTGALVTEDDTKVLAPYETHIMVLKDISLSGNQPAPHSSMMDYMRGKEGDIVMVNGQVNPRLNVRNGQVQRWRILNASTARFYKLSLENHPFYIVGTDGGLLDKPYQVAEVLLSPGERVDVLVKFNSGSGNYVLRALPYSRMNMSSTSTVSILTTTYRGAASSAQDLPALVNPNAKFIRPEQVPIAAQRTLTLSMMSGAGYINGQTYDTNPFMMMSSVGTYEVWTIQNNSMMDHPFHQHVNAAQVLSVSGGDSGYAALYPNIPAMKDVVLVPRMGSVTMLVPIMDYTGMTMFHCHILEHEDIGMMGDWHIMDMGMGMSNLTTAPWLMPWQTRGAY